MLNWIRWNLVQVVIGVVVFALMGGSVYIYTAVQSSQDTVAVGAALATISECDDVDCINKAVQVLDTEKMLIMLPKMIKQNPSLALEKKLLTLGAGVGSGRCFYAAFEMGYRIAEREDVSKLPQRLAELDGTISNIGENIAYPCQRGFITGLADRYAKDLTHEQRVEVIKETCREIAGPDSDRRPNLDIRATFCIELVSTLAAAGTTFKDKPASWEKLIEQCDLLSTGDTPYCYTYAVEYTTGSDNPFAPTFDVCETAKSPHHCTLAAAHSLAQDDLVKIVPGLENFDQSISDEVSPERLAEAMGKVCDGVKREVACKAGYALGLSPNDLNFTKICDATGDFVDRCNEIGITYFIEEWVRHSAISGDVLYNRLCATPAVKTEYMTQCRRIINDIYTLDYEALFTRT